MGNPTTVKMNNGHEMPLVGFGLWKVNNDTCADQVYQAIKVGYRLLDGAAVYGNEKETGQGIARAIKDGIVKRSDLFIVSKLWNSYHDRERVLPIAKKQLADYGIDYFDLYLIHFPISLKYVDPSVKYPPDFTDEKGQVSPGKAPLHETWAAMEQLVDQGLAKSIGVSNYNGSSMLDLLRYARIPPQALQIEHHPYLSQPVLVDLCQKHGIAVTAYSSFGAQSYIELENKKAKDSPVLMENPVIKKAAGAHGKTPAQVLLRWATQREIAVIPKSNNPGRLAANLDVTQWDLTTPEMTEISALDRNLRFNDPVDDGMPLPIFA